MSEAREPTQTVPEELRERSERSVTKGARHPSSLVSWSRRRDANLGGLKGTGAMAQLVARLVRNEKVRGSNPLSSTTKA